MKNIRQEEDQRLEEHNRKLNQEKEDQTLKYLEIWLLHRCLMNSSFRGDSRIKGESEANKFYNEENFDEAVEDANESKKHDKEANSNELDT